MCREMEIAPADSPPADKKRKSDTEDKNDQILISIHSDFGRIATECVNIFLNPVQGQSFYQTSIDIVSAGLGNPTHDHEDQGYLFQLS